MDDSEGAISLENQPESMRLHAMKLLGDKEEKIAEKDKM